MLFCIGAPSHPQDLFKLKGPTQVEVSVPNAPIIHQDLAVGPVVTPTPGPDLPPLAIKDPIMEEYPFAESINNLLKSLAKIVVEASNSAHKEQCISPTVNSVSLVDQLEDGEIVRDPSLARETARSLLVSPTLNQCLLSPGAPAGFIKFHYKSKDRHNGEIFEADFFYILTSRSIL
ncbi:hypothetical protein SUGI_0639300 [Cryptomeria japonica]|nr:hypothetical protein SUGI_0639300 [Cryptomeria japonica]